jgi:hypothetical protein
VVITPGQTRDECAESRDLAPCRQCCDSGSVKNPMLLDPNPKLSFGLWCLNLV